MNEYVKQSIDSRKIAFSSAYELTDVYKKKVDELFKRIEEFGKTCSDAMDFETKFASSPLNKEYTDLFTEVASNCKYILPTPVDNPDVKSNKQEVVDEVLSDAKYIAREISMPARRKAREAFDSKMRDTPLGKIEQASNTMWVVKRLFGKKKNDDE
jgi:hypothetical protein